MPFLLTQLATCQSNHTILTSSVKAVLKAVNGTVFLELSFGVITIFYLWWEIFSTRESTLRLTARTFSYLNIMKRLQSEISYFVDGRMAQR